MRQSRRGARATTRGTFATLTPSMASALSLHEVSTFRSPSGYPLLQSDAEPLASSDVETERTRVLLLGRRVSVQLGAGIGVDFLADADRDDPRSGPRDGSL